MQINTLKVKKSKSKKRIGRGGKKGTYSGRGMKGQKSRSGAKVKALKEGGRSSLVMRMKKIGGFKSLNARNVAVNVSDLEKKLKDGDLVDVKTLISVGLIHKSQKDRQIKILSSGEIKKKLTIASGILLSSSAKSKIEKAGGKIEKEGPEAEAKRDSKGKKQTK